jgi:hypothetical protein
VRLCSIPARWANFPCPPPHGFVNDTLHQDEHVAQLMPRKWLGLINTFDLSACQGLIWIRKSSRMFSPSQVGRVVVERLVPVASF